MIVAMWYNQLVVSEVFGKISEAVGSASEAVGFQKQQGDIHMGLLK